MPFRPASKLERDRPAHGDSRESGWSISIGRQTSGAEPTGPGRIAMSENDLAGATALVTGASRGFGRGIAIALRGAGAQVVGVARDRAPLEEVRAALGESFIAVSADAADPTLAERLIDAYHPASWCSTPAQARSCGRCSTTPGRRSRSTGRPTSGSPSTGYARPCSSRCGPAAGWSWSAAVPRWPGHRSAVATPAPRPPSASSPSTPRTRQRVPVWASPSPQWCPESRR
jgi:short chain dehydrogenase